MTEVSHNRMTQVSHNRVAEVTHNRVTEVSQKIVTAVSQKRVTLVSQQNDSGLRPIIYQVTKSVMSGSTLLKTNQYETLLKKNHTLCPSFLFGAAKGVVFVQ